MPSYIPATCENGIVNVGNHTIKDAVILSAGVGKSTGVLMLDGLNAYYVASSANDLKSLIQSVSDIVSKLVEITTGLDAVSTSPGGQAAQIALLTQLQVQLLATKDLLS